VVNFVERAVRSLFFTIQDGGQPCDVCEHPYLSHIKLHVQRWVIIDVPCRECESCLCFAQSDREVHGG
jgi:hypothetical protein